MADNNYINSDVEALHELAAVIKDMRTDMQQFNRELNNTANIANKVQRQASSGTRTMQKSTQKMSRDEWQEQYRQERIEARRTERQNRIAELRQRISRREDIERKQRWKEEKAQQDREAKLAARREEIEREQRWKEEKAQQDAAAARSNWYAKYRQQRLAENGNKELRAERLGLKEKPSNTILDKYNAKKQDAAADAAANKKALQEKQQDDLDNSIVSKGKHVLIAILLACVNELRLQTKKLQQLNKEIGGVTGAGTAFVGEHMSAQLGYDAAKEARRKLSAENNSLSFLVTGFKKVTTALTKFSDTLKQAAAITFQYMGEMTKMQGARSGLSVSASSKVYHTSRAIAMQRMQQLYPDLSMEELISTDLYSEIYSSLMNAIIHGGEVKNTMLSTEGWEGWAFENLGYNPNVDYSEEAQADARRRYLESIQELGTDEEKAERMKYYRNQSRLLKQIAGQLFSFDEVETQQAISMADTIDSVDDFGNETTQLLRDQEDLWQELIQKYGLTQQQIDNIKRLMNATGISLTDIKALLEAGVKFDDATTNNIIHLMNTTGISVSDIVRLLEAGITLDAATVEKLIAAYEKGLNTTDIVNAINGLGLDVFLDMNTTIEDILKWLKDHPFYGTDASKEDNDRKITVDERRAQADAMQKEMDDRFDGAIGKFGGHDPNEDKTGYIGPDRTNNSTYHSILEASQQAAHRNTTNASVMDSLNALLDKSNRTSLGAAFATGGIGTSKVTNATLFENGPEAVIPLSSELGKQFMADALSKATDGNTNIGGDTININIDGPTILSDDHSLTKLATLVGDTYTQVKARRGGQ